MTSLFAERKSKRMVISMKDCFSSTIFMEMERRPCQMVLSIKVGTVSESGMEKDNSWMLTDRCTLVFSWKATNMEMVSWNIQMVTNILDSTLKIKKRDMEYLRGPMAVSTMETGKTVWSTVLELIVHKMERLRKENGLKTIIYDGLRSKKDPLTSNTLMSS